MALVVACLAIAVMIFMGVWWLHVVQDLLLVFLAISAVLCTVEPLYKGHSKLRTPLYCGHCLLSQPHRAVYETTSELGTPLYTGQPAVSQCCPL